ncbi:MAG: hypothetical protein L6R38_007738 [Xanthoria sp. 2 TBL-2021]|nr:MAG: hypothetical protein L6R38_007738 [Xanthoria sp. 2 TBL-2021]
MTDPPGDTRRTALSPRPKGRENAKDTLCRNVTIYGHCRYEEKGCAFNHDVVKATPIAAKATPIAAESAKKRFNVDSPSFTPASLAVNGNQPKPKATGISPKFANAAPFRPKVAGVGSRPASTAPSSTSSTKGYNPNAPEWTAPDAQEYLPSSYNNAIPPGSFQPDQNGDSQSTLFDHYTPTPSNQPAAQSQINPYAQDGSTMGSGAYFQSSANYPQQLQHHLYAALPPHREVSQPNQRTARDFFIPENLRQNLARKSEASRMTIPNSTLPPTIAHYHSLVPLVNNSQKTNTLFGYQSHAYKAESNLDGKFYCLRRLQGYRVNEASSEHAIRNIQQNWKRVRNGNVVSVHLAFTNSGFGDSSLIFVTDFHPLAETLAQKHFASSHRYTNRYSTSHVPEETMWSYIVQIASALKSIHSTGLAARVIDATKILLTDEGRIRLNACGILDVIQADAPQTLVDLQRLDLHLFGKLILALGTNNASQHNQTEALHSFSKSYSPRIRQVTSWLLERIPPRPNDSIDSFLLQITSEMASTFDGTLHQNDALMSNLGMELENARMVRLNIKMSMVLERPEYKDDPHWAAHGTRECIRLFRDYVFHQVDAQGRPSTDLGHILGCLNRLDAGSEEKIMLTTRDDETVIVVSYKEIKAALESAFLDLYRRATRG